MSNSAIPTVSTATDLHVTVLSCFYNDAQSAAALFPAVGEQLRLRGWKATLVLVDDGSTEERPPAFMTTPPPGFSSVELVTLHRNGGHQLAIAVGFAHIAENVIADIVLVMDADGEDRPEDVPNLVVHAIGRRTEVVFAARTKRSESLTFRVLYQGYRLAHSLLTGRQIRFGNFSAIPSALLPRIIADPNLRVHYAASVVAGGVPHTAIPSERGKRLYGRSKLNLVGLVAHGLAAITCYNEIVGVRLLFCTFALATLFLLLILVAIGIRIGTTLAIPGWATYVTCSLVLLLFQTLMLAAVFTFLAIGRRTFQSPPLVCYYRNLINRVEKVT